MRGKSIMARHDFHLTDVTSLPAGSAIAADNNGIPLFNVYAPTGTARRADRKRFYNSELPALFYIASISILIGGDFKCVLHPTDTTGPLTMSEIVCGLALLDAWSQDPQRPAYTQYSLSGATRIDRFYVTKDILVLKTTIGILPAAFTDHNAVVLRLSTTLVGMRGRRCRWKIVPDMVTETDVKGKIRIAWARWRRSRQYYPDDLTWWERCVKPQQHFLRRRAHHRNMENHLYECLHDLQSTAPATDKLPALKRDKAKLVRFHAERGQNPPGHERTRFT